MKDFKGRTILVIGGGGLIGRTLVRFLIQSKANVCVLDMSEKSLDELRGSKLPADRLLLKVGDASSATDVSGMLDFATEKFGSVEAAINTAYPRTPNYGRAFFEVAAEDFAENVGLHTGTYFNVMQQCAKYSIDRDSWFSLVQFSSIYGVMPPRFEIYKDLDFTMPVEYAAAKAAIVHLTKYVTAYTKNSKFRVNSISPGGVEDGQDKRFLERYAAQSRSKGMLDSSDLFGLVEFLCSDASKYICGQNIVIDDAFST